MTRTTTMDKEHLAAFADGELTPEEAAAVVMHLADHPQDQAYVDDIMAANIALARAFDAPMQDGVPDRFARLILPDAAGGQVPPASNVVSFRPKTAGKAWVTGAFAAGLAVAAALATVAFLPSGDAALTVGPVAGGSAFHQVLVSTPSGDVVRLGDASDVKVLASLPTDTGFCREFEVISTRPAQVQLGLACQTGEGWTVDVLLAETYAGAPSATDSYVPASGDEGAAIERWLDRRNAGAALTLDAEAELLARGWTR